MTKENHIIESRPPVPPFTRETAIQKVRMAEDGWNSRNPQRVSMVYTQDSQWRNRAEFPKGRAQIVEFLTRKWAKEQDYRLIKELWAFDGNRIAITYTPHGALEPKEYEVNPLALVQRDHLLYIVCTLWDYKNPMLLVMRGGPAQLDRISGFLSEPSAS